MGDSIKGIFNETISETADISKNSGGIGIHIQNIRPKGSYIRGTNGTSDGIIPISSGQIGTTPIFYTISVPESGSSVIVASASTFIQGVYPYFYGVTNASPTLLFQNLNKLVEKFSDKILSISSNGASVGVFYFAYDADYPDLTEILDQFGNNIISNFSQVTQNKSFVDWSNKDYKIYKWIITSEIYPASYQFRY